MTTSATLLAYLRDPRLSPLATSPAPAWLWAADASRILWANAAGAAALGESSPRALSDRSFGQDHPAAREVSRLIAALPAGGAAQLARLRGFGGGVGRAILCGCSRVNAADGAPAVLVAATEPIGAALPFGERVRRLFGTGDDAVFAADGGLLQAGPDAADWLAGHTTLAGLGAGELAAAALRNGRASGDSSRGPVTLERIGAGDAAFLLATFAGLAAPLRQVHAQEPSRDAESIAEAPLATGQIEDEQPAAPAPPVAERPVEASVPKSETKQQQPAQASPDGRQEPAEAHEPAVEARAPPASEDPGAPAIESAAETAMRPLPQAPAIAAQAEAAPGLDAPADEQSVLAELHLRLVERRHPLRFMWQIDAECRFTIASDSFLALIGPRTAATLGRPWSELADGLGLDPDGRIVRAIGSHDTWSGITVEWPADGAGDRLPVALSGLPAFGRDRTFIGYRGFGVCRDVDRIAAVIAARRAGVPTSEATPAAAEQAAEGAPAAHVPTGDAPPDTSREAASPVAAEQDQAPAAPPPAFAEGRPQLTVVPAAKNVVPFRGPGPIPPDKRPALTTVERHAFHEIAKALGARVEGDAAEPAESPSSRAGEEEASPAGATEEGPAVSAGGERLDGPPAETPAPIPAFAGASAIPSAYAPAPQAPAAVPAERMALDRMPIAVLAYRADTLIYANRAFFDWTGFRDLADLAAGGGFHWLFPDSGLEEPGEPEGPSRPVAIRTRAGESLPVEARLFTVPWEGETALLLMLGKPAGDDRHRTAELALRAAEADARELASILDTATDGVIVTDGNGGMLAANRSAEALFGYEARELAGRSFTDLFAPESHREALDYLDGLVRSGVASILNDGREVIGRVREGGLIPLFMTMGRIADQPAKFCAVFRDITQWKRAEEELVSAKRQAEKASSAKSDFLAKISHEIRTPLNAIIGFSEVMMEQRFGPIGNERYRGYLKDIHTSGQHLIALLTDLLDLSKIEAGKLDLAFARVDLNEVTQEAVAIMQPQANRERIIIRTSLSTSLPPVVADARSIRQIVLNLLSNSIKFTGAGGQVIVSTALTDDGEAVLRVRDTGIGMSEKDIATALEPFRQLATSSRWGSAVGSGLGLPLTKALAEANRASFHIRSAVNSGTLVEIAFPPTRVLAE